MASDEHIGQLTSRRKYSDFHIYTSHLLFFFYELLDHILCTFSDMYSSTPFYKWALNQQEHTVLNVKVL